MAFIDERQRYVPTATISWPRLPILAVVPLLAALPLAWVLKTLYAHNWYIIFLAPLFAGLLLGGVMHVAVGLAHCANRWLAGAAGVLAGVVLYLGYYHLTMLDLLPPGFAARVDVLPRYIRLRLETDVSKRVGEDALRNVGKPGVAPRAKDPSVAMNTLEFAMELLMVVSLATVAAWRRASYGYSAELGQWMKRDKTLLPRFFAPQFIEALEESKLAEFVGSTPAGGDPINAGRLILEYVDEKSGSVFDYPVYASVEDFKPSGYGRRIRRTMVRQVELNPTEVLELRPLFPHLAQLLEMQHAQLRDLPRNILTVPEVEVATSDIAEVVPVSEPYRKRVRGPGYALAVNLRGAIPLVYFLLGGGAAAAGVWLVYRDLAFLLGSLMVVAGVIAFSWGCYTAMLRLGIYENRWINRRLRQEIGQRSETWVDAADPAAMYVSIIPRESFSEVKLTLASDVLLMRLDKSKRAIFMEGDADRYRIPAGAISVCEPQCFFHPIDKQRANELWMVRLMIRVQQGMQELLISPGQTQFTPLTNDRRHERAENLAMRIKELYLSRVRKDVAGPF